MNNLNKEFMISGKTDILKDITSLDEQNFKSLLTSRKAINFTVESYKNDGTSVKKNKKWKLSEIAYLPNSGGWFTDEEEEKIYSISITVCIAYDPKLNYKDFLTEISDQYVISIIKGEENTAFVTYNCSYQAYEYRKIMSLYESYFMQKTGGLVKGKPCRVISVFQPFVDIPLVHHNPDEVYLNSNAVNIRKYLLSGVTPMLLSESFIDKLPNLFRKILLESIPTYRHYNLSVINVFMGLANFIQNSKKNPNLSKRNFPKYKPINNQKFDFDILKRVLINTLNKRCDILFPVIDKHGNVALPNNLVVSESHYILNNQNHTGRSFSMSNLKDLYMKPLGINFELLVGFISTFDSGGFKWYILKNRTLKDKLHNFLCKPGTKLIAGYAQNGKLKGIDLLRLREDFALIFGALWRLGIFDEKGVDQLALKDMLDEFMEVVIYQLAYPSNILKSKSGKGSKAKASSN